MAHRQGHYWNIGDTIVSGIGQGYIQVTPLQLATYVARVATGRAVQPHLTRTLGGVRRSPGRRPRTGRAWACRSATCKWCARACGRW
jgi:cell division protein FtsI/penicillin-binding protein 2